MNDPTLANRQEPGPGLDKARLCPWASVLLAGAGKGRDLQSLGLIPGALKSPSFLRLVVTVLIS